MTETTVLEDHIEVSSGIGRIKAAIGHSLFEVVTQLGGVLVDLEWELGALVLNDGVELGQFLASEELHDEAATVRPPECRSVN